VLSKAYGGEAVKKSSVFEWHIQFKEGHNNVEDDKRSGCPRSHRNDENVEKVQKLVHSDGCLSFRTVAVQLNLDNETVRKILSNGLSMKTIGWAGWLGFNSQQGQ